MSDIVKSLVASRKSRQLTQLQIAEQAGLNRMTVQKIEAATIDPRLSSLEVLARALGMEMMLVPADLRPSLEDFVRSGGKFLGQPAGAGAPLSIVDGLLPREKPISSDQPGSR